MSMSNKISVKKILPTLIDILYRECGFSFEDLARIFGVSIQTIANWESGKGAKFEAGMAVVCYTYRLGLVSLKELGITKEEPKFVDLSGLTPEHEQAIRDIAAALKVKDNLKSVPNPDDSTKSK